MIRWWYTVAGRVETVRWSSWAAWLSGGERARRGQRLRPAAASWLVRVDPATIEATGEAGPDIVTGGTS